jgi:mRNA interferase RelE/StbE
MTAYTVYVTPRAWREIKDLPGHMRQRVRRTIDDLAKTPRPPDSKPLTVPDAAAGGSVAALGYELRRIRMDRWRIVYAVTDTEHIVDVLTVQKRPPYDYGDLGELLKDKT